MFAFIFLDSHRYGIVEQRWQIKCRTDATSNYDGIIGIAKGGYVHANRQHGTTSRIKGKRIRKFAYHQQQTNCYFRMPNSI